MPRQKNPVPTYKRIREQARCWVNGRWIYLGRWQSPESLKEFERLCAELRTAPAVAPSRSGLTVAELLVAFGKHARDHYRRADGSQTTEVRSYKEALAPVFDLYGDVPASEFGPKALKAVRQQFIDLGWCRSHVNRQVGRVRRVWKWGASEELVPVAVFQSLATVQGLQEGRTEAPESDPVAPVPHDDVEATLRHLNRTVRGLVEFQRLTGCRPGEACALRRCDLDTSGEVWLYRPVQHKTRWRGKGRVIPVGPRARAVLEEFPTAAPEEFVFSPRRAVAELHAARAAARVTPRYPSHQRHNERRRKGEPGASHAERYRVDAYERAVARAAEKAGVPRWAPNQLRHSFGTEVRKRFGFETAGAALGHTKMSATEVYTSRDMELALRVAREVG
jgi:integrase